MDKLHMAILMSAMVAGVASAQTTECQFDTATNSVVCGDSTTKANANNAVVLGKNATVDLDNSASIGNNAKATEVHTTKKGGTYGFGGTNTAGVDDVVGVVSVGNPDETRQIQNVGAGVIKADSTDAVNASQLHATNAAVSSNAVDISANSSTINNHTKLISQITTNINNLSDDVSKGLNFKGETGETVNYQLGETVHVLGDDNIATTATDNGLLVTLNPNVKVDSVTTGNTVMNNDGVTIQNSNVSLTSAGLNNGGNVITNVAPGVADTDAVNVSQLNALNRKLSNQIQTVEDIANAGTAAALAASQIPQPYTAGASMVGFGAGTYGGQSAFSLGLSTISDNGKWIIKGSATYDTQQKAGVGVGVGYQW